MTEQANNFSYVLQEAFHLLSIRRAIVVASASTAVMMQDRGMDVKQYVRLAREQIELEIALKATEGAVLLKMGTEMTRKETAFLCYELLNTDGEANISVLELAEGLRKINDFNAIEEVLPLAEYAVRHHAGDTDGLLSPDALEDYLESTCQLSDCTFHDLCQLCVAKIAFAEDGRMVLEDMVAHVNHEAAAIEDFDNEVVRARLALIFHMLDFEQVGKIPFEEVVKHLFHFTRSFDWEEGSNVLLMMEKGNDRTQDLAEFMDFMLNFSASLSGAIGFHDLANAVTISNCRRDVTDQDIKALFIDEEKLFSALEADEAGFEDIVAFGKLHRLFQLMDTDNSGTLDQCELAMGMRKFTSCRNELGKSIEECVAAIQAVDEDGDGHLDVREFAKLIAKFANKAEVEMHHLIDFMVVQCSMQSNSKKEEAYLEAYKKLKKPTATPTKKRGSHIFTSVQNMWQRTPVTT